jgi:hypothetical protein
VIAGSANGVVSLLLGNRLANATVTVGSHDLPLPIPADAAFLTAPRGGDGEVTRPADCPQCLSLRYHLGPQERAAYALFPLTLPADTVAIGFDLLDDGSGADVRVALRSANNDEVLLHATTLDRPGWRHIVVYLASTLAQPARLRGIYAIGATGAATNAGSLEIKNLMVAVAGSS